MARLDTIRKRLLREHPDLEDPDAALRAGHVTVDGIAVTNPRTLVRRDARVRVAPPAELRGTRKLRAALAAFAVDAAGTVALDLGACTGGFTVALLDAGARRVYAVDAGHGQLLGRLRRDPRVVDLERTNLAALDTALVPDEIALVTIDLSYLSIARAVTQLGRLRFAPSAQLVALVKPMFELGCAVAPDDHAALADALLAAAAAVESHGWELVAATASPHAGAGGAREGFLHARIRNRPPRAALRSPP